MFKFKNKQYPKAPARIAEIDATQRAMGKLDEFVFLNERTWDYGIVTHNCGWYRAVEGMTLPQVLMMCNDHGCKEDGFK